MSSSSSMGCSASCLESMASTATQAAMVAPANTPSAAAGAPMATKLIAAKGERSPPNLQVGRNDQHQTYINQNRLCHNSNCTVMFAKQLMMSEDARCHLASTSNRSLPMPCCLLGTKSEPAEPHALPHLAHALLMPSPNALTCVGSTSGVNTHSSVKEDMMNSRAPNMPAAAAGESNHCT